MVLRAYIFRLMGVFILAIFVTGCVQMSEIETDEGAGLNGGFEITRNGLPVNWQMYTPNTVPESKFEIVLDGTEFKEGKQSLRFDVEACQPIGGWKSPGIARQFKDKTEGNYKVSFWYKNKGASFYLDAGGVSPKHGNMKKLIVSDEDVSQWKYMDYEITVEKDNMLRLEWSVLKPGVFWIDDVRIEKR